MWVQGSSIDRHMADRRCVPNSDPERGELKSQGRGSRVVAVQLNPVGSGFLPTFGRCEETQTKLQVLSQGH